MTRTGWIGEEPEEAPRMPLTELALARSHRGQQPGAVLAQSLARAQMAEGAAAAGRYR